MDKKVKYSKSKEANKNLRKNAFKRMKKEFEDIVIADASAFGGPEARLKQDLYLQGRSPENFPGFDQAKRIRGGLKGGGRAGYKSGSKGCKLAMKGKGRAYGKNS